MDAPFKIIRQRLDISQKDLAALLGMCQGSISRYERGSVIHPTTAYKVIEIAAQKGVSLTLDDFYAAHRPKPVTRRARTTTRS